MNRSRTSFRLTVMAMLITAVIGSSCHREQRRFRVPPEQARTTRGAPNTPVIAGGAGEVRIGFDRPSPSPEGLESNAYELARGRDLYDEMNCTACHGAHGGGGIGPALSDQEWIYGWDPQIVFDSIVHGRPNGMPSFEGRLSDHQVWEMAAYVRSLSGLTPSAAAPGRDQHLSGPAPPNSIGPAHPRSSTAELDELHRGENTEFHRRGWIDPRSGQLRIPSTIAHAIGHSSPRSPATHPASKPTRNGPPQPRVSKRMITAPS